MLVNSHFTGIWCNLVIIPDLDSGDCTFKSCYPHTVTSFNGRILGFRPCDWGSTPQATIPGLVVTVANWAVDLKVGVRLPQSRNAHMMLMVSISSFQGERGGSNPSVCI